MSRLLTAAITALVAFAAASQAAAETVALAPMMDATLYEDAEGDLANGAGSYLFVGRTNQPRARRALLAFDIAGAIPAGSTVTAVELQIEVSRASDPSGQTVMVHRVTESWGEGASDAAGEEGSGAAAAPGDATWIHRSYPNDPWITAGGSFVPAASAQRAIGGVGSYSFSSTPQLVSDVQSWLDDPSGNFGWILVMEGSAKRFNSRENAGAASRPRLEIEYQTGGGTLDTLYYLPAAAKSAGAQGSFFVTDLDIQNGDANPATYQLLWLPRGQNNSTPDASATFTLDPGAAVRYRDVLGAGLRLRRRRRGRACHRLRQPRPRPDEPHLQRPAGRRHLRPGHPRLPGRPAHRGGRAPPHPVLHRERRVPVQPRPAQRHRPADPRHVGALRAGRRVARHRPGRPAAAGATSSSTGSSPTRSRWRPRTSRSGRPPPAAPSPPTARCSTTSPRTRPRCCRSSRRSVTSTASRPS